MRLAMVRIMGAGIFRGVAAAAILASVSLSGCGGDGTDPAVFSGVWDGSLSLAYAGGGGGSGALTLDLDQDEDFLAGWASWSAIRERQSVTGPIDGDDAELWLHFRCEDPEFGIPTTVTTVIVGEVNGNTLTFSGASGLACTRGGAPVEVTGGTGQVVRRIDGQPL